MRRITGTSITLPLLLIMPYSLAIVKDCDDVLEFSVLSHKLFHSSFFLVNPIAIIPAFAAKTFFSKIVAQAYTYTSGIFYV